MIRIHKSTPAPAKLSGDGVAAAAQLTADFAANQLLYTSRTGVPNKSVRKFDFDNSIYGDADVKQRLITDQHDKCCFCEGKFSDHSFGDVEHYRPKKAYKKRGDKKLTYPGYYWLAYDWNNLMYSCEKCNRKHKRNDFPLNNEATRKRNHLNANLLSAEDTLLINPNLEDPSIYITFNEEVPVAVANSLKGKTSIKAYGLERLNDARLENLKAIKIALALINLNEGNAAEVNAAAAELKIAPADLVESIIAAKQLYNFAAKDTAKFAACVRCKFPHLPIV